MAKSKPIGVRFDLDKLEIIKKEQNLTSMQSVLNYLMDFYLAHSQSDKIIAELDKIKTKILDKEDLIQFKTDKLKENIKLTDILLEILTEKKLCPKGKAYYNRRKAAGEKPSAYLSGRAVKVCKGLMEEDDLDMHESLRDWFKKEDWVRIDTAGNITGPCGTMKKGNKTTRCLPRAKANSLSKEERAATSKKKAASDKQFVPNTKKAKVKLNK